MKTQVGIVSWGNGCARPNYYGVYARTNELIDYILKHAPNAQIVEANVVDIMPILDLLLFKDVKKFAIDPPGGYCHGGTLNLDETIITDTEYLCIDPNFSGDYYKIFNFNLIENERITITSSGSDRNAIRVELYSGIGRSLKHIKAATGNSVNPGNTFMINDLEPGQHTVIIRTNRPSTDIELSLIENKCDFMPIALDTETEFIFRKNCQDTTHRNPFVSYHSFTLPSAKDINITAKSSSAKRITIYGYTDGQLTNITASFLSSGNVAVQRTNLATGDYVIKVTADADNTPITLKVNTINCLTTDSIGIGEQKSITFSEDCKTLSNRYQHDLIATITEPTDVIITSDLFFNYNDSYEPIHVNGTNVLSLPIAPCTHKITVFSDDTNTTHFISMLKQNCVTQSISTGDTVTVEFSDACRYNSYLLADYRTFFLSQNSTVKITIKSSTYKELTLFSGSGDLITQIAYDSQYGNMDAMIEEDLGPGTYTIRSETDDKNGTVYINP